MCIPWCAVVQTSDVAAMEMCGQYRPDPLGAGCHCYLWPICDIAEFETLRLKTLNVDLNTKTVDDVFVKLTVAVNYQVNREKIYDAFYRLSNRERQMYAYTCDSLRSFICSKTLDEAFAGKGECAGYLREHLSPIFEAFGVQLVTVLVTDIVADRRVQDAMNEINSSKRLKTAAVQKAEGEKMIRVKKAEAEAESMHLSGIGVARQREAIMKGFKQSILDFKTGEGTSSQHCNPKDVMDLLILTQYFDSLESIGTRPNTRVIMMPTSDKQSPIRNGVLQSTV